MKKRAHPDVDIQSTGSGFEASIPPLVTCHLIMNPIVIDPAILPFELTEGAVLDRATSKEISLVRKKLPGLAGKGMFDLLAAFETHLEKGSTDGSNRCFTETPLAKKDWRYYVVRIQETGAENTRNTGAIGIDLGYAASISRVPLEIGTFYFGDVVHGHRPFLLTSLAFQGHRSGVREVTFADLTEISTLYALKLEQVGRTCGTVGKFPAIGLAMQMLDNLSFQISSSPFRVLGYFAIIEMLITHKPSPDGGDSILRQMKGKIPLLSRRFDSPLPYPEHFGPSTSVETIWKALYEYRSLIAHGAPVSFTAKMQILKDQSVVESFLLIVVQALLRHSLREPELYEDLRAC